METEIWKDVKGYEGHYQISNLGRVKSLDKMVATNGLPGVKRLHKGKIRKPQLYDPGYFSFQLWKDNKQHKAYLHTLIAQVYIPNPENKPTVNHKNGIKTDNRIENLEWATYSENNFHAFNTGLKPRSTKSIFTEGDIKLIMKSPLSNADLGRKYSWKPKAISDIRRGGNLESHNRIAKNKKVEI